MSETSEAEEPDYRQQLNEMCQVANDCSLYISAHFTEREGDQAGTVAEDRRQREQMLALSQVEADSPLLLTMC